MNQQMNLLGKMNCQFCYSEMDGRKDKKYCSPKCKNMANNSKTDIGNKEIKISICLRNVPADIYSMVIDKQAEMKKKIGANYGLEATIYKMIRDAIKTSENE